MRTTTAPTFAALSLSFLTACVGPPAPGAANAGSTATAPGAAADGSSLPPTSADGTPYQWKNVRILGGGFVTGVIFSPVKAGVVYARTDVGGSYRQNPADKSWIPLTDHFGRADGNLMGVESMAADPIDPNVVYAAVGTYSKEWATNGAILRSADQGQTWSRVDMPLKMGGNEHGRSNGERLAVDPNDNKILFFGSRRNGLLKSTDAAATWKKVDGFAVPKDANIPDAIGIQWVLFDKKSGTKGKPTPTLYAGVGLTDVPMFVSNDAGANWKPVPKQPTGLVAHHADFDANGTLFVTYGNLVGPSDLTNGAVYKFDPKQQLWTDISPLKPNEATKDRFGYSGLALDARKPGTLVVTTLDRWTRGDEIFRSTDGGKSWKPLIEKSERDIAGAAYLMWGKPKLNPPHWIGDIDIDPFNGDHAMFVTGAGIWGTDNLSASDQDKATNWSFRNRGLEETVVTDLISPPAGANLLSGVGDICGFRHDDLDVAPPNGWFVNPNCNTAKTLDFAELKPEIIVRVGTIWGEGKYGGISRDGAKTWQPFAAEPKNAANGGAIAISADGKTLIWALKKEPPVVSRDGGAKWAKIEGLPAATETPDWVAVNLRPASDRVNPNKLYIFDTEKGQIYASSDAGANFELTQGGLPALPDYQRASGSIQTVPGFEGDVWLTTNGDVYRSTDSGTTFGALGSVEESHALGFGKAAPGRTYPSVYLIGKVGGVQAFFRSDDIGRTWVRINDDQHQFGGGSHIIGDPRRFGRVYVGTHGRGILYGDPK